MSGGRIDCCVCSWFMEGATAVKRLEAYVRHLSRGHLT